MLSRQTVIRAARANGNGTLLSEATFFVFDDTGRVVAHMPRNSPVLLPPELVAKVRDWIQAGALDN